MAKWIEDARLIWESLAAAGDPSGWRGLPVGNIGACELRAALRFPGKEQAVLAGFRAALLPNGSRLPEGAGFAVERVDPDGDGRVWLALVRNRHGSVDLFEAMVADVCSALTAGSCEDESQLLACFLGRIRAWQEFMRKGGQALGPEEEIGLVGELVVLEQLISAGVPADIALTGWIGPLDGEQDFHLGSGALETKTTVSESGFIAKFGSLGQLDDSVRSPLYVVAVSMRPGAQGLSLPERVARLRLLFAEELDAPRLFEERLLAARFRDIHADRYSRRFVLITCPAIGVGEGFPRLIAANVPPGVLTATYQVDLRAVPVPRLELLDAINSLGGW